MINLAVFENFRFIDIGSIIITMPTDNIDEESKCLLDICKDNSIKKWLYKFEEINNLSQAREFIISQMMLIVSFKCLFLTIKYKDSGRVIGYINLDTPQKGNFNSWMLEYCIEHGARNNGVMFAALHNLLSYLQSNKVEYVTALNESLNIASEKLLQKLNFTKISERSSSDYSCYMIRLN